MSYRRFHAIYDHIALYFQIFLRHNSWVNRRNIFIVVSDIYCIAIDSLQSFSRRSSFQPLLLILFLDLSHNSHNVASQDYMTFSASRRLLSQPWHFSTCFWRGWYFWRLTWWLQLFIFLQPKEESRQAAGVDVFTSVRCTGGSFLSCSAGTTCSLLCHSLLQHCLQESACFCSQPSVLQFKEFYWALLYFWATV